MKKINITSVLLLCTLLILGLSVSAREVKSTKPMSFRGESENWSGTYTAEVLSGLINQEGVLKYMGQDVDSFM